MQGLPTEGAGTLVTIGFCHSFPACNYKEMGSFAFCLSLVPHLQKSSDYCIIKRVICGWQRPGMLKSRAPASLVPDLEDENVKWELYLGHEMLGLILQVVFK